MFRWNLRRLEFFYHFEWASIQPLFRWNKKKNFRPIIKEITRFQYNRCFGGTNIDILQQIFKNLFQYNRCFGGTTNVKAYVKHNYTFQYNRCFGGIFGGLHIIDIYISFNTTVVSVEYIPALTSHGFRLSFNTTVVSVEFYNQNYF